MQNLPEVKMGIVAVSRDCFPIELSKKRKAAVLEACQAKKVSLIDIVTVIENESDTLKALAEIKNKGINAVVIYLGNFGPEGPLTLLAQRFDGPVMLAAAAEESGDQLMDDRGDAYCGMLNASLGSR